MKALAIIPARGGSKGLPRKNVLPLAGKPLIAHTIKAAIAAQLVDRIVVSTDDVEIAAVARTHGAEVVMRPATLAGDLSRSEEALLHVLDELEAADGYRPDVLAFLQCTSPLTTPDDIDGTLAKISQGADSALAVAPFHYFLWRQGTQSAEGINHDKTKRLMRQEREPEFLETGSVYAMSADGFRRHGFRFFGRIAMYEIPVEHWLEIDEPADFRIAQDRMARLDGSADRWDPLPQTVCGLVFDFDGIMTDDRVFVSSEGVESVACSRSDGMGVELLRKAGLPMAILSKERNTVVAARAGKLGLPCKHGVEEKLPQLQSWLEENHIDASQALYMGNDVNDIACMRHVGCAIAPADAHPQTRAVADIVLASGGGRGAVRELADHLLASNRIQRGRV